jgi:hypothetical protein
VSHRIPQDEVERIPSTDLKVQEFHARLTAAFGDGVKLLPAEPAQGTITGGPVAPGAVGGYGPRREAPKLVSLTHSSPDPLALFDTQEPPGPCYRVVMHDFGQGVVETVVVKQQEKMPKAKKGKQRNSRTREDMDPEHLKRSIIRAKKEMRHKLLMMQSDRMLTLTYRDNVTDLNLAYNHLAKFEKYCRRYWREFPFVAVPEFQKRGAVHFHIALNRFYHVGILRAFWHKAIGSKDGNIHITSPTTGGQWNRVKIARYMAKYMAKAVDQQEIGRKRYSSSRGIPEPKKTVLFITPGPNTFRLIFSAIEAYTGAKIRHWSEIPDSIRQTWFITTY